MSIMALRLALCLLWLLGVCHGASVSVKTGAVIGHSDEGFVSATFDWWRADDPTYGQKWEQSGILTVDLNNSNLIAAARGLAPGVIRIGGSPEDSIVYEVGGTQCHARAPKTSGYYCSQVHPEVYGCLTMQRWKEILSFAIATGTRLVFGLNACYGRNSSTSPMDLSNIEGLLRYTASLPRELTSNLYGFEFGNELSTVTAQTWAHDLQRISSIIDVLWPSHHHRPRLMGPDTAPDAQYYAEVLQSLRPGTLHSINYHQYVNCEDDTPNGYVLSPDCLSSIDTVAATLNPVVRGKTALWAGETAEHSGGGRLNLTNVFKSSFFYSYQLGTLSAANVSVAARQCLVGGYYGLLNKTTWQPNPDFWVGLLFHRLMGPEALAVSMSGAMGHALHAFAHCSPGGATSMLLVNLAVNQSFTVELPQWSDSWDEWHITGSLTSSAVAINNHMLSIQGGTIPPIPSVKGHGSVSVPQATIVFLHDAASPCGSLSQHGSHFGQ